MTTLQPAHLGPFTVAFERSLREGRVTTADGRDFADRIFDLVQEHQVRVRGEKSRLDSEGNLRPRTGAQK